MMQAGCIKKATELSALERQALGQANAHYVAERYSLKRWAEKVVNAYEKLLIKQ
jgi:hypothetical protein